MKPVQLKLKILVLKKRRRRTVRVKFDYNHVISLCKKAIQKFHALARISHYMNLNKCRNLMKAFITSQHGTIIRLYYSSMLSV